MSIFRRPDYQSEATQFINKLKEQKPQLAEGQLEGRALLWDKSVNRALQDEFGAARVPQKAYVYYAYSDSQ